MPLEIRQIGIRLRIGDDAPETAAAGGAGRRRSALDLLHSAQSDAGQARLVEQCVEAVLVELDRRRGP